MSLKAKIEAVIYASEEPVTLAQLVGLLGQEGQAELDHLESQQQDLALEEPGDAPTEPAESELVESKSTEAAQSPEAGQATAVEIADQPPDAAEAGKLAKLKERRLRDYFRTLLDALIAEYAKGDRGLEVREVAGGFRLATKPEYHDAVRGFVKGLKPPMKLTLQALETLAVVAYKQPVTAPEVSEIRGVDSAGVMGSLMARKLVTTAGRKQVIGRPILYKTTKDFLLRFGLKDINELPSIEEFEKMAGELNEAIQEEIQMEETHVQGAEEDEAVSAPDAEGTSGALDERGAVPAPTHVHHDAAEDLMSDRSTSPEGHKHEPATATELEAERDTHSDQADGTPEE